MTTIQPPQHAGSRPQAQELLASLPGDLSGQTVVLDCRDLAISTPSFFDEDEIVKVRAFVEAGLVDPAVILRIQTTSVPSSIAVAVWTFVDALNPDNSGSD